MKAEVCKPGQFCEHMCDTFMGRFVRSRDAKPEPPAMLSKSKGGSKKEFHSACKSCPNVAVVLLPLLAVGKSAIQPQSPRGHVSSEPPSSQHGLCTGFGEGILHANTSKPIMGREG